MFKLRYLFPGGFEHQFDRENGDKYSDINSVVLVSLTMTEHYNASRFYADVVLQI